MARRSYSSLREFLTKTQTTQIQFAKRVGLSQSQVSKILNGHQPPSLEVALAIAEKAGIPVESLRRAS